MCTVCLSRKPTRSEAFALLCAYTKSPSLLKHALSVEAVMADQGRRHGADVEEWGIVGLAHDFDYEVFPNQHCKAARRILEEAGWPESYIRAIESHAWGICTEVKPETLLERTLYACDELTGFVTACALVRPSRSVVDLEVSSVRKRWKTRGFAASVNREVVERGVAMLDTTFDELTRQVIDALRQRAAEIGV